MRHLPGFVPANLPVSRDRRHVASYAQWRSQEDFDAMPNNPEAQPRRSPPASDYGDSLLAARKPVLRPRTAVAARGLGPGFPWSHRGCGAPVGTGR
jgi:hypothetical protein